MGQSSCQLHCWLKHVTVLNIHHTLGRDSCPLRLHSEMTLSARGGGGPGIEQRKAKGMAESKNSHGLVVGVWQELAPQEGASAGGASSQHLLWLPEFLGTKELSLSGGSSPSASLEPAR